jgi:hypothetical protein
MRKANNAQTSQQSILLITILLATSTLQMDQRSKTNFQKQKNSLASLAQAGIYIGDGPSDEETVPHFKDTKIGFGTTKSPKKGIFGVGAKSHSKKEKKTKVRLKEKKGKIKLVKKIKAQTKLKKIEAVLENKKVDIYEKMKSHNLSQIKSLKSLKQQKAIKKIIKPKEPKSQTHPNQQSKKTAESQILDDLDLNLDDSPKSGNDDIIDSEEHSPSETAEIADLDNLDNLMESEGALFTEEPVFETVIKKIAYCKDELGRRVDCNTHKIIENNKVKGDDGDELEDGDGDDSLD